MNLIETFQNLVAQVPELVQPLIVALAAAIPFIEGEGAVTIGIIGGIHPAIAAIAAIFGNFVCVAILVLVSASARDAVVSRHRQRVLARGAADGAAVDTAPVEPKSERALARRAKFQRSLERYGVPGVSLLGPLLLPTHFTATLLAAAGIGKVRILIWQGIAIIGWTVAFAILISGLVYAVR